MPGYNVMGICKAALDSIVKYLAYDLGPKGVRVNALSPGPLQTISGRGAGVDEMLGLYEAMAPLGRNVTHEEAGKCGAFLALGHVVRDHRRNSAPRRRLQHHGLPRPDAGSDQSGTSSCVALPLARICDFARIGSRSPR